MPEDISQDVIAETQKSLGKYVKKPPLNEKFLKKPPFRFLHDIVKTVIKETGFLKGLFTEDELNSENVKDKDAKIAFLTKLIEATKSLTKTNLSVRPSKIVAGLEPTETNVLLQTIAKALDKKIDSTEYVNKLKSGEIIDNPDQKKRKKDKDEKVKKPTKTSSSIKDNKEAKPKRTSKTDKEKQKTPTSETPKSVDRTITKRSTSKDPKTKTPNSDKSKTKERTKTQAKIKEIPSKTEIDSVQEKTEELKESPREIKQPQPEVDNKDSGISETPASETIDKTDTPQVQEQEQSYVIPHNNNNEGNPDEVARKRVASALRPKSARPKSGDFHEKVANEIVKNDNPPSEVKEILPETRPKSSLRPPSVRPTSARPGAPRLRPDSAIPIKELVPMGKINVIVENADKDNDDEEETVVIQQSNPEFIEEQGVTDKIDEIPKDNKGHLVEQILEQINENEEQNKSKVDIDWQSEGIHGKDATNKEVNNLKTLIQALTKTANPLGKLLNYLHEDIDAMHVELESWSNTKKQLFIEIAKQKKISAEMNKPLLQQLDNLNQEIRKVKEEILNARSIILRNDQRIKELVIK